MSPKPTGPPGPLDDLEYDARLDDRVLLAIETVAAAAVKIADTLEHIDQKLDRLLPAGERIDPPVKANVIARTHGPDCTCELCFGATLEGQGQ
ncbi:MAG TPA: hypothetical protein VIV56_07150 [Gemmatimonadales bacterium]